jgi:hypothetical protein
MLRIVIHGVIDLDTAPIRTQWLAGVGIDVESRKPET